MAIAEILCALKDASGRIRIPGFTARVVPPAPEEMAAWARLPFDVERYRQEEAGVQELTGEPEFTLFERLWARPTLEVHGVRGGFIGEGAKTVIPAQAVAKLSLRLVADQRPEEAIEQLKAAVAAACPRGVSAEFHTLHSAAPTLVNPGNRFLRAAASAMAKVFGKETVYVRSGGSIPVAGLFDKHLGLPSVMMGFGLPDDNLHAPNEKLYLPNFYRGIEAVARYLEEL
jgi:acetylornithine deacetylase/succinyl-diaminopimelate desuccinylase-like protein